MNCPKCNTALVMSERHGVEIDYCPDCRGIWLDRGELDKVLGRENAMSSSNGVRVDLTPKQGYPLANEYTYKRKKRDSFFGDLFDF